MVHTLSVQPDALTREQWAMYHAFRRRWHEEMRPDDALTPDDVEERRVKRGRPLEIAARWVRVEDGRMVSLLRTAAPRPEAPGYESGRHVLWAEAYVDRDHRRRGIATSWVPTLVEEMDRRGATIATMEGETDAARAFMRRIGAEARLDDRSSRLDLRSVDWDLVARWVREGRERSPDARLQVYEHRVPDEALEEVAAAKTLLLNLMPFEGLEHGEIVSTADGTRQWYERLDDMGADHHSCVVRDPSGAIVAMSDVTRVGYDPLVVHQGFTGVHPDARGRGMGRWVKAAMLEHVRRAHPDAIAIDTTNARSNGPMLAINEALGFRLVRMVTTFQATGDALRAAAAR